ncbi:hypothetical protein ACFP3Q_12495 [Nocardioides sp. GCM10027113]|uniref:hypothetical protein n=1 Tax=unclassified Nocardioides TaxID=2615069 RepID=UPI00361AD2AF
MTAPAEPTSPSPDPVPEGPATPEAPSEPQRLYFHIGLPKSGSTYLQAVLGGNRSALKEAGFVYPFVRQEGMFHAAVEMAGSPARWGLDPDDISGTFAHLLRRGRRLGGTVVISHEIFGAADDDQVETMAALLEDFEVHLVVTARDLGRTVTAGWQEQVKNGSSRSFAEFTDELLARLPDDPRDPGDFWPPQNLLRILERWGLMVPPERMHVVACPRSGAAPDLLWRRFAEAIGLDPEAVDLAEAPQRNESLGTAQIAFLRRVVDALDGRLEQPWYSRVAKRWFAQTLLSRTRSGKPQAPTSVVDPLARVSAAWIDVIREGGYQVHGDLEDLMPEPAGDARHPDDATDAEMLAGLPEVVAEMLLRNRDLQAEVSRVTAERDRLIDEVAALTGRLEEATSRRQWARSLLGRR